MNNLKEIVKKQIEYFINNNNHTKDKDYFILIKENNKYYSVLVETNFPLKNMEIENYLLIKNYLNGMWFDVKLNNNIIINDNDELLFVNNKIYTDNLINNLIKEDLSIFEIIFTDNFSEKELDLKFWKQIGEILKIDKNKFSDFIFYYYKKYVYPFQIKDIICYIENQEIIYYKDKYNDIIKEKGSDEIIIV